MIWSSIWLPYGVEQNVIIDETTEQWRRRLPACIQAKRGHFEYLLWYQSNTVNRNELKLLLNKTSVSDCC